MEPTEQTTCRRDYAVTVALLIVSCIGALSSILGFFRVSSFAWSLMAGSLICMNTGIYPHHLVWRLLRRAVGHKFDTRFHWGELNIHWPTFSIGLRLSSHGDDDGRREPDMLIVHGIVFGLYLHLPTYICARFRAGDRHRWDDGAEFGFYTIDTSVVWKWKQGYYSWHIPFFSFNHHSTEVLSIDGKRTVFIEYSGRGKRPDRYQEKKAIECANCEVHPYTYTRRNGEVQHRMATIFVDRMTWTRKWFPFLKHVKTCVDVTFNEEIGEEVGSWKGGTTGCSWLIKPGHTALQALREMEVERFFEKGRHGTRSEELKSTKRGFLARLFLP